jgi:hypothetical protein
MKIFKKLIIVMFICTLVIITLPAVSFAATIEMVLPNPEVGWQRIDDSNSNIVYSGTWNYGNSSLYYNNKQHESTTISSFKYKFYGTKFRIITDQNTGHSTNVSIKTDGVEDFYSTDNTTHSTCIIGYEKTNLELGYHTVEVTNLQNNKYNNLDAIDIDDTGYIVDYNQPLNLTASVVETQVNLSWNAVDGATNYNIKRSLTSGGPYEAIATSSAITFTDTDVVPGTTYYYVASAIVSGAESPDSNEASAIIAVTPALTALKVVLEVGEELQLSVDDDLDVNTEMTWTSSDNAVAIVDGNGAVTALTPGNTVITVTSADGTYTDYINILVVDDADDYRLAVDLKAGKSCRLTVDDLTDTVKVTWASMDPTIATVSTKGKVTAVREGLTIITATDEEGNIIGQVYVRVRQQ